MNVPLGVQMFSEYKSLRTTIFTHIYIYIYIYIYIRMWFSPRNTRECSISYR